MPVARPPNNVEGGREEKVLTSAETRKCLLCFGLLFVIYCCCLAVFVFISTGTVKAPEVEQHRADLMLYTDDDYIYTDFKFVDTI